MFQALDNEDGTFCVFPEGGDQTLCLRQWVDVDDDDQVGSIAEVAAENEMCGDCRGVLEAEHEISASKANEWRLEVL